MTDGLAERMAARAERAAGVMHDDGSTLKVHPLADRFPMMTVERLEKLAENIREHGLRHPIVRYEGKILDGRNRYRGCLIAGVEPTFADFDGDDPAAFVWRENLERRDLTDEQRAMIVVDFMPIIADEVERNRRRKIGESRSETGSDLTRSQSQATPHATRRKLAEEAQVSTAMIRRATALKAASPKLAEEVKDGTMKMREAERATQAATKRPTLNPSVHVPGQEPRFPRRSRPEPALRDELVAVIRAYPSEHRVTVLVEKLEGASLELPLVTLRTLDSQLRDAERGRRRLLKVLDDQISMSVRKDSTNGDRSTADADGG